MTPLHEGPCYPGRLQRAYIVRFHHCPDCPFRRRRILAYKLPVRREHAAKIQRPPSVHAAVDDHAPNFFGSEFLRDRREVKDGVDLPVHKELHRVFQWRSDEGDVLVGVEANMSGYARDKQVVARSEAWHGHNLSLEIRHGMHSVRPEQLETAGVNSPEDDDRVARSYPRDQLSDHASVEVDRAGGQGVIGSRVVHEGAALLRAEVLDLGESLISQELFGRVLRSEADARNATQPDPRRLRRRLGTAPARPEPHDSRDPGERSFAEKLTTPPLIGPARHVVLPRSP